MTIVPGMHCGAGVDQLPLPRQVLNENLLSESFEWAGHENSITVPFTNLSLKIVFLNSKEISPNFSISGHSVLNYLFLC